MWEDILDDEEMPMKVYMICNWCGKRQLYVDMTISDDSDEQKEIAGGIDGWHSMDSYKDNGDGSVECCYVMDHICPECYEVRLSEGKNIESQTEMFIDGNGEKFEKEDRDND